ncbi:Vng1974h [Halorubrum sp. DM2]|uniref:type IV pilin n=1 Tax=Halorubrum sp. DM2 TaxID=2527867 RepID=UPI0024B7F63A|nr:type IV pilin [Halorubrum sp. DM2]VTT88060.1 Vng1974h [Halorubrum sp. DM2]
MPERSRGVTSVVSTVLLVAIVVVLSATLSVFALGVTDELQDPGPYVSQSSGQLVVQEGSDGGIVRITHVAGDPVPVEETEIAIDATDTCGERERLINLPEDPSNNAGRFADSNVASGPINESIVSGQTGLDLGVLDSRTSNTLGAGSHLGFRLTGGECQLTAGDRIVVRVVHVPSGSVTISQEFAV